MKKAKSEEARSRQVQLMQKQSLIDKAKERAKNEGVSLNEWVNRAIQEYLHYGADDPVEQHKRRVQILLTPTTYNDLTELADKYGRSINQSVEHAIQAGLSGPDYFNEAKYLHKKNGEIISTLNARMGGFKDVTWKNAWEKIRSLQKEMSAPKIKKAEKEKIQAQIDAEADSILEKICAIQEEINRIDHGGTNSNA